MPAQHSISIKLTNDTSDAIKKFEKNQWEIADQDHYGKSVDFTKTNHKLVAKNEKGEIIGTLDLMIQANLAFVEGLLVCSKHRNQGIGRSLMTKAEVFATEKKCTKIYLETNEGWAAVEFYKKCSYNITGRHEKHALGQNGLIFTKFL
jgi:ribosomal protein S18 acetylase RimI-like enzyme